jgi:hypothetical protein
VLSVQLEVTHPWMVRDEAYLWLFIKDPLSAFHPQLNRNVIATTTFKSVFFKLIITNYFLCLAGRSGRGERWAGTKVRRYTCARLPCPQPE